MLPENAKIKLLMIMLRKGITRIVLKRKYIPLIALLMTSNALLLLMICGSCKQYAIKNNRGTIIKMATAVPSMTKI